jgi:hypothetical protein
VGHSVYVRCKVITLVRSSNSAHMSGLSVVRGVGSLQESAKACTVVSSDEGFASFCSIFILHDLCFYARNFVRAQILPDPKCSYVCILRLMIYRTFCLHDVQFLWMFH